MTALPTYAFVLFGLSIIGALWVLFRMVIPFFVILVNVGSHMRYTMRRRGSGEFREGWAHFREVYRKRDQSLVRMYWDWFTNSLSAYLQGGRSYQGDEFWEGYNEWRIIGKDGAFIVPNQKSRDYSDFD